MKITPGFQTLLDIQVKDFFSLMKIALLTTTASLWAKTLLE